MRLTEYISGGSTRCLQASYRMALLAFIGTDPGEATADQTTGYVEGRGTWQFRMILGLSEYGFKVIDHEAFDAFMFLEDPEAAIRKQVVDPEAVRAIIAETDIAAESAAVKKCLDDPNVKLINSIPSLSDLEDQLTLGRMAIVNLDLQVLQSTSEREGHFVLVESFDDNHFTVHDPGINGSLNRFIPRDLFKKAWTSPSDAMANYIAFYK